jgi:hypothetical protein
MAVVSDLNLIQNRVGIANRAFVGSIKLELLPKHHVWHCRTHETEPPDTVVVAVVVVVDVDVIVTVLFPGGHVPLPPTEH